MIESLLNWDRELFVWINQTWQNAFFDAVLPWMREAKIWIPLYIVFIGILIYQFRKRFWIPLLFVILAVGSADRISSGLFKPGFERLRPCHEPQLEGQVTQRRLDGKCGGQYGFISSHASNHFALALFLFLLWRKRKHGKWAVLLFVWASVISISQVYVGVHYPGDILVGAILGLFLAYWAFYFCRILLKKYHHEF